MIAQARAFREKGQQHFDSAQNDDLGRYNLYYYRKDGQEDEKITMRKAKSRAIWVTLIRRACQTNGQNQLENRLNVVTKHGLLPSS